MWRDITNQFSLFQVREQAIGRTRAVARLRTRDLQLQRENVTLRRQITVMKGRR
jgi:hypothetical protein